VRVHNAPRPRVRSKGVGVGVGMDIENAIATAYARIILRLQRDDSRDPRAQGPGRHGEDTDS
jgi:hypothetical protein